MTRIVISEIVAPADCPQRLPDYRANPRIGEIVDAIREQGGGPTRVWALLDQLALTRRPRDRAHRRFWRLMFAHHLRDALRARIIFRWGKKMVGVNKPPVAPGCEKRSVHGTGELATSKGLPT